MLARLALLGLVFAPAVVTAADEEPKPGKIDTVYKGLFLTPGQIDGQGPFKVGDTVKISFTLKNTTTQDLNPPPHQLGNRVSPTVGVVQFYLDPAGAKKMTPSGGFVIFTGPTIKAGASIPLEQIKNNKIETGNFAAGKYRFTAEYKSLDGKVLQTQTTEFELK